MKTNLISMACACLFIHTAVLGQPVATSASLSATSSTHLKSESGQFLWEYNHNGMCCTNKKTNKCWIITPENSKLPSKNVTCMLTLSNGHTYIGTEKGILFWDNYAFLLITTENSRLTSNHIVSMRLDDRGDVLVTAKNGCRLLGKGKYFKTFRLVPPADDPHHEEILVNSGRLVY